MSSFCDAAGRTWIVELDGLLLGELRDAGVDLTDDGLLKIEQDPCCLVKMLVLVCREQIAAKQLPEREFARSISGVILDHAIEAARGAAEAFFPPRRWSEIQSALRSRREENLKAEEMLAGIRPMLATLNRPEMPEAMRAAVLNAIGELIEGQIERSTPAEPAEPTASRRPAVDLSASGRVATRPTAASGSPASSGSTPEG